MEESQLIRNLQVPERPVDVVLDTDAYNEIDDQFAIAYLLKAPDLNPAALYAAPFFNDRSSDPEDGMEKSYREIKKILSLMQTEQEVFKGSRTYLPDENTPVVSPAAEDLCERAMHYTSENPLYVVAIGAITNIASALLMKPEIAERIVIIWLGGNARHCAHNKEFNLMQDVAAGRVVMQSEAPFVQLPCDGVVSEFRISKQELLYWLADKNPTADYLARNAIREAERYASETEPWTRVIWDVTAVAWLRNKQNRFMESRLVPTELPEYDHRWGRNPDGKPMRYVYQIHRDRLMNDLIKVLTVPDANRNKGNSNET